MRSSRGWQRAYRGLAAFIVATTAVLAAGCSGSAGSSETAGGSNVAKPTFKLAKDNFLTIATYGSNPPVNIDNPDGTMSGIEGDLLTSFANKYGLKLKLAPTTFSSMILDVQQGRADMGLFVYHSKERAQKLYYTSALLTVPAVVFTSKDFAYSGPDSLKGKKIAVVVGQLWTDALKKAIGGDAILFQGQPQAAQALLNGQVDGYVTGLTQMYNPPLSASQDKIAAHPLDDGDWGMPASMLRNVGYNVVSCENSALAKAMNEHLGELISSGDWKKTFSALPPEFAVDETVPPAQGCGS